MPDGAHAVLQDRDGRSALLFERSLAHSPERVWRALTTHGELSDWHPTPFELEPRPGGRVAYRATPEGPQIPDGGVLEYDPPRLLAYTWGDDELRWELLADSGGGCLLRLTHLFDDRFKAARDAAGWHLCLDALSGSLEGASRPEGEEGPRLPQDLSELNDDYQQRFAIKPEQATPPPRPQRDPAKTP
jgi:uncharacterized protein YndB with AHSA1/START domain